MYNNCILYSIFINRSYTLYLYCKIKIQSLSACNNGHLMYYHMFIEINLLVVFYKSVSWFLLLMKWQSFRLGLLQEQAV